MLFSFNYTMSIDDHYPIITHMLKRKEKKIGYKDIDGPKEVSD